MSSVAQLHRSGSDAARILIVGDDLMLGWGSATELSSLPGRLANELHLAMHRGIDLDLRIGREASLADAPLLLADGRLWRYDAIVLAFDPSRSLRQSLTIHWRYRLRRLLDLLQKESSPTTRLLLLDTALPHERARFARVRRACIEACARIPRADFITIDYSATDGNDVNLDWSHAVVTALIDDLKQGHSHEDGAPQPNPNTMTEPPEEDGERVRALHAAHILDTDEEARFDVIVERARQLFNAEAAEMNFIDRDRQWTKAASGLPRGQLPREVSFCNVTVQYADGFITGDARNEPQLSDNPFVTGQPGIRFYAGFPIESEDGYRIGSLCVWDTKTRDPAEFDGALLRDLALRAQEEIRRRATSDVAR